VTLFAHGIGGRTDLPLPSWQVAWAAGFAVASAFIIVNMYWERSRLSETASHRLLISSSGKVSRVGSATLRWTGLVVWGVALVSTWSGSRQPSENLGVGLLLIWLWVGIPIASSLFGDVWVELNPFRTIADAARTVSTRAQARVVPSVIADTSWPAVVAISVYLWLELAYHDTTNPRSIAVFLTVYSAVMTMGAVRWGMAWLRSADGFTVLFGLLATIAPVYRDESGDVRLRMPLSGLRATTARPGLIPFVVVVLGSTTFDGFTRTEVWTELTSSRSGWSETFANSVGLTLVVIAVGSIYLVTIALMARSTGERVADVSTRFCLTLVPIVLAYSIAHYFSLLILEGQRTLAHFSDPFNRGWDLFGTADWTIHWTIVSPATISWVQAVAIATGHVLAVVAAHDIAVATYDRRLAKTSQYPMLAAMVAYTVIGLFLLLGD